MANRTNHPKKVQPVIEEPVIKEPIIAEEIPAEEVVTIDNVILLENISKLRFVDENGKLLRLELRSSGVYWLYPA